MQWGRDSGKGPPCFLGRLLNWGRRFLFSFPLVKLGGDFRRPRKRRRRRDGRFASGRPGADPGGSGGPAAPRKPAEGARRFLGLSKLSRT